MDEQRYDMSAACAVGLLRALQEHGVSACVGGGWSVDALLAEQTRAHSDLDLHAEVGGTPRPLNRIRWRTACRRAPERARGSDAGPAQARPPSSRRRAPQ